MSYIPDYRGRSAARLAAVQALYQLEMRGETVPKLLTEFHNHRLGQEIEGAEYLAADEPFFDDVVVRGRAMTKVCRPSSPTCARPVRSGEPRVVPPAAVRR